MYHWIRREDRQMKFLITLAVISVLLPGNGLSGEVYKWVDEKGTVNLTDDLENIPERFMEQAVTLSVPDKYQEPSGLPERVVLPSPPEPEKPKAKPEESPSAFIPFGKFMHLTEGMTEAEVLMRVGQPTQIVADEVETRARLGRSGLIRNEALVKRYYYIGDADLGERTTVITFRNGRIQRIERIFPPTW
jgi:hypothetical protein